MKNQNIERAVELMKRIDYQILFYGKVDNESVEILGNILENLTQMETYQIDELYSKSKLY